MTNKIGLLVLFVFASFFINAQTVSYRDSSRLEVLDDLKAYIHDVVKIDPGANFYTEWVNGSGMLNYVYISPKDALRPSDSSSKAFLCFDYDSLKADSACKVYAARGFHVLHYRTTANSTAKLSRVLMDAPLEAFVSDVIHEAVHRHLRIDSLKLFYSMEEAVCDVVANHYTSLFLKDSIYDYLAARRQAKQTEAIYTIINDAEDQFINKKRNPEYIYAQTKRQLDSILNESNNRLKLRFDYPVNNAFLLRNHYYAHNYFFVKVGLEERNFKVRELCYLLSRMRISKGDSVYFL